MARKKPYSKKTYGRKMKILTIHLPEAIVEAIDLLIDRGIYNDRSSAVRAIVTQSIPDLINKYGLLEDLSEDGRRESAPPVMNDVLSFKMPGAQVKILDEMASTLGVKGKGSVVRMALDYFYRYHYLPFYKPLLESARGRPGLAGAAKRP
jgi:Arc/MetJ-type ribon-helix-helix transcriptional regulator